MTGNKKLRDFSEKEFRTRPPRSNGVILGTLLQATRGMLLIVFNWMLFIQFANRPSPPGIDLIQILPPSIYFIIGALDILTTRWMWKRNSNGWRYGIASSTVILLLAPTTILMLIFSSPYFVILFFLIDLFAITEILVLLTTNARKFYGVLVFASEVSL